MIGAMEEWRSVQGQAGYEVSSIGRVRSWKRPGPDGEPRIMRPFSSDGYMCVEFLVGGCRKKKFVHRLVLEAFVGPAPAGMEACHYPDQTRSNCKLSNLRWDTRKENSADKIRCGFSQLGEKGPGARVSSGTAIIITMLAALEPPDRATYVEIGVALGVNTTTVRDISVGKSWPHLPRPAYKPRRVARTAALLR